MNTVKKIFAVETYTCNNNIGKRWFVRIKVPDFEKGCFVWRKCYGDINKYHTVPERQAELQKLLQQINTTQQYTSTQGSRKPGYISYTGYTDLITQLKIQLQNRQQRIRQSTQRSYAANIRNLQLWLLATGRANLPAANFTKQDANQFLSQLVNQGLSNSLYNAHLRLFKSLYRELIAENIVKENPFAHIKGLPKKSTPALYFQDAQIKILKPAIQAADPQLWLFVQFVYYCFIRPGELRQLKIKDVIFTEGKILIPGKVSKNGKQQIVSIPEILLRSILKQGWQLLPGDHFLFGRYGTPGIIALPVAGMRTRHKDILNALGFDIRHKLYSWKHTGAIACARAGMPLKELQMQLRHHSLDQVNTYLQDMLVQESDFIKNRFPAL